MTNLRQRTLVGLGWTGAARLLGQLLQMAATVVLARLLSPQEYGLLGMVLVFTGFASYVADMGLGASIIQRSEVSARHLNSVFWLNVASGLALSVVFALSAPLVARFYDQPQLRLLTAAIAVNFVLASLNVVQNALLDKSLHFRTKFWIESVAYLVSGSVAVALAFSGAGVWSLVGQQLTLSLMRVLMMWAQSPWRPALSFDLSAIRELLHFSGHLTAFGAIIYWSQNVDKLVIGRWIGSVPLGIYSLADKLMRLPLTNVNDVTTSVMFPALSSIQDDMEGVRRAYLRGSRMIALITFPTMMALAVLAEPAVLVVYG
ncbi:MAG TPA: lipopolysaccharide biosynthesis protein, partial [Steroidobacteraceae bacterium]